MSDVSYYNPERYPDPTAYAGLTAAIKAEKGMHFKPVVYICSPYSGNIRLNTANARRYCRYAVDKGCIPLATVNIMKQYTYCFTPDCEFQNSADLHFKILICRKKC